MKIIYMGTPTFAVPALQALIQHHQVLAVCTQPDRPAGRGHKLTPSPVKETALVHNIPVHQPETLRIGQSKEIRAQLKAYNADIFVVAAYGLLLPKGILHMPPLGCINIHASLLPKYRGASPIHAALLNGDTKSGVTIMHMAMGLDTGDIILEETLDILPEERFPTLHDRMAALGADAILKALALLQNGDAPRIPQDDALSSYAPMLKKTDGLIHWQKDTASIINQTRALDPWPGSYTIYEGTPLKIWTLQPDAGQATREAPGTVLAVDPKKGVLIKTGDAAAWATELQGQGSKRMPATEYLRGRTIEVGAVLG
ncbi:MAG: methionyl-tRNA formyltransferase [Defluviitaleaceae bacterium]|nr:methionyl-tRNA formyltransferase [Defluviitaleaceae bacterium]